MRSRPPLPTAVPRPRPGARFLEARRGWMALPPLFAAAMAALALAFSGHCRPAPLTLSPLAHQDRIKARLDPGALAPAAPSPAPGPALTDRDWTRLAPGFNQALQKLFARMAGRGYGLTLLEGYRSPERQTLLYHSGRNLTRAQAGRSLHQYGLAADLAPLRDGEPVRATSDPWAMAAYQAMGQEAEALGLVWGGRWACRDYCHVEASLPARSLLWTRPSPPPTTPFPWDQP